MSRYKIDSLRFLLNTYKDKIGLLTINKMKEQAKGKKADEAKIKKFDASIQKAFLDILEIETKINQLNARNEQRA